MSSAFAIWNGGKDSLYALWRATQAGVRCELLVTFIDADTELVMPHRIPPELIAEQAGMMGVPFLKVRATRHTYERELRNTLFDLRSEGLTHGIFPTISNRDLRDWIEGIVVDYSIRPLFPLWGIPSVLLVEEQRRTMHATIVRIDRNLSESYLGKDLSSEFIEYLQERGLDPCGESGEYDTFVCSGPLMEGEIILTHAERRATPESVGLEIDFWKHREQRGGVKKY